MSRKPLHPQRDPSCSQGLWLMLLLSVLACGEEETLAPSLHLEVAEEGSTESIIIVRDLPESWYRELEARPPQDRSWIDLLAVHVASEEMATDRPPMLGRHEMLGEELRFTPRFPLEPGLAYHARLDLAAGPTPYLGPAPRIVEASFRLPTRQPLAATECLAIFPSSDRLPENLLRLYLQFSGPMRRGVSRDHISVEVLEGPVGKPTAAATGPAPDPFVEIAQELWDPGQQRLTLLLDPGRIKRGLRPHDEAGPPLVAGNTYRLVVDSDWLDASGEPLVRGCEKTFQVGEADRIAPNPDLWRLKSPSVGSRQPLRLFLDNPLDHSLLTSRLAVEDPGQRRLSGEIRITEEETVWSFSPLEPWKEGRHRVHIEPALEDPSGNRIGKVFDQPMGSSDPPPSAPRMLEFEPSPSGS